MSKNLENVNPVLITASLTSAGVVDLAYEGEDLTAYDEELLIQLDENDTTEIMVGDFIHYDRRHNVYVFEEALGGLSSPWTRVNGSARSGTISETTAPRDIDMWVVAVLEGAPAPALDTPSQAQQTGAKRFKAKIRKKGPLPLPIGMRVKS